MLTLTEFLPARISAGAHAADDAVVGGGAVGWGGGFVAGGFVTGGEVGAGVGAGDGAGGCVTGGLVAWPRPDVVAVVERAPPFVEPVDWLADGSGSDETVDASVDDVGSVLVVGASIVVETTVVVGADDADPGAPAGVVEGKARPRLSASLDLEPRLSVITRTAWNTTVVATTVPTSHSTISSPRLRTRSA